MATNLSTLEDARLNIFFNSLPQQEQQKQQQQQRQQQQQQQQKQLQQQQPPNYETPNSNSRKRHRTSTTTAAQPPSIPTSHQGDPPNAITLSAHLSSSNSDDIINTALNKLLKLTSDHDLNYALGTRGELVLEQLVVLFDDTIGWKGGTRKRRRRNTVDDEDGDEIESEDDEDDDERKALLTPSKKTWQTKADNNKPNPNLDWLTFCAKKFASHSLTTSSSMMPSHTITFDNVLTSEHEIRRLEVIVMILRNLSYVQANIRFLLHATPDTIRLITGALAFRNFVTNKTERGPKSERDEDLGTGNSSNNICLHAVHTLMNLAPYLEWTGRKVFMDVMLLNNKETSDDTTPTTPHHHKTPITTVDIKSIVPSKNYGKIHSWGMGGMHLAKKFEVKDETFSKVPQSTINPIVGTHIRSVLSIFPPLVGLLSITSSRALAVASLELWKELVDNVDNRAIFSHTPNNALYRLVRLLWVPRLGPDSLEYMNPMRNMVTRVSALKLMAGYDNTVDYELRDRSLELLVKLAALSSDLKRRIGQRMTVCQSSDCFGVDEAVIDELVLEEKEGESSSSSSSTMPNTRFYDAILPALTTKVGRDHTPQLAAQLLADMATIHDNRVGIMYIQRKVLRAASSCDTYVAHILMKGVLY